MASARDGVKVEVVGQAIDAIHRHPRPVGSRGRDRLLKALHQRDPFLHMWVGGVGPGLGLVRIMILGVDNHEQRSEEHTSELQSLMRISYAVFCLKKKKKQQQEDQI